MIVSLRGAQRQSPHAIQRTWADQNSGLILRWRCSCGGEGRPLWHDDDCSGVAEGDFGVAIHRRGFRNRDNDCLRMVLIRGGYPHDPHPQVRRAGYVAVPPLSGRRTWRSGSNGAGRRSNRKGPWRIVPRTSGTPSYCFGDRCRTKNRAASSLANWGTPVWPPMLA